MEASLDAADALEASSDAYLCDLMVLDSSVDNGDAADAL